MNEKILPCPFCGEMPFVEHSYVWCLNKKCLYKPMPTAGSMSREDAIESWNRRSQIKEQSAIPQQPNCAASLNGATPLHN